jgi:hypothetical protein
VKHTKIINLGVVRNLLPEWLRVKQHIAQHKVSGWYTVMCDEEGREALYMGGVYKHEPARALQAALKISAARALIEDDPPQIAANTS